MLLKAIFLGHFELLVLLPYPSVSTGVAVRFGTMQSTWALSPNLLTRVNTISPLREAPSAFGFCVKLTFMQSD